MSDVAVCGLDCAACGSLGNECSGCKSHGGKVYWAQYFNMPACPIYACAKEKQYTHCRQCAQMPCETWHSTREPGYTDEEFAKQIALRQENLKGLA